MANLPPANVPGSQFLEGFGGFGDFGFGTDPVSLTMMGLKSGFALSQGNFIGAIPVLGGPISMMTSIFGGGPGKTTASKKAGQAALEGFEPQAEIYESFGIDLGTPSIPESVRWKIWENRGDIRRGNDISPVVDPHIRAAIGNRVTSLFGQAQSEKISNALAYTAPFSEPGFLTKNPVAVMDFVLSQLPQPPDFPDLRVVTEPPPAQPPPAQPSPAPEQTTDPVPQPVPAPTLEVAPTFQPPEGISISSFQDFINQRLKRLPGLFGTEPISGDMAIAYMNQLTQLGIPKGDVSLVQWPSGDKFTVFHPELPAPGPGTPPDTLPKPDLPSRSFFDIFKDVIRKSLPGGGEGGGLPIGSLLGLASLFDFSKESSSAPSPQLQQLSQETQQEISQQLFENMREPEIFRDLFPIHQPQTNLKPLPAFAFPFIPYENFGFVLALQRTGG